MEGAGDIQSSQETRAPTPTSPPLRGMKRLSASATGAGIEEVRKNFLSGGARTGLNMRQASKERSNAESSQMQQMRAWVEKEVEISRQACREELLDEVQRLDQAVLEVQDTLKRNAEGVEALKRTQAANLEAFMEAQRADLQEEVNTVTCSVHHLVGRCRRDQESSKAAREQDLQRMASLEGGLRTARAELSASLAVRWSEAMAMVDEHRLKLTGSIQELEHKLTRHFDHVLASATEGLSYAAELQRQHDGFNANFSETQQRNCSRITALEASMLQAQEDGTAVLSATEANVAQLRGETERRLADLDHQARLLRRGVSEAESFATRRVEWLIPDVAAPPPGGEKGAQQWRWLSPEFAAGGVHSLQLELMLPVDLDSDDEDTLTEAKCTLSLMVPHRVFLVCKLYVGAASVELKHAFDGRTPLCAERLCVLRNQVCPTDGALRVGVEILEALREVEHLPEPVPGGGPEGAVAAGPIFAHRYLNHRMLDLVQSQVELMHSRLVRRIEWHVESASALQRCFPEGECICSKPFEAAGVSGLQLVFYPCGYTGARPGYCSYFLQCPANSALRCWLSAGKQRREAHLSFERPGVMGRTNFCHFESCVDTASNSVLLVLEIEEAQQSLTEAMTHQPKQPGGPALERLPTPTRHAESSTSPIRSTVKVQRALGGDALDGVWQLPSIWTSKPEIDVSGGLEGFQPFSTLKAVKKPATPRPPAHIGSRRLLTASPDLSLSSGSRTPSKYMMYATR